MKTIQRFGKELLICTFSSTFTPETAVFLITHICVIHIIHIWNRHLINTYICPWDQVGSSLQAVLRYLSTSLSCSTATLHLRSSESGLASSETQRPSLENQQLSAKEMKGQVLMECQQRPERRGPRPTERSKVTTSSVLLWPLVYMHWITCDNSRHFLDSHKSQNLFYSVHTCPPPTVSTSWDILRQPLSLPNVPSIFLFPFPRSIHT